MGERNDLIERLRECDQPLINQPLPFSQVRQRIRDAASALETAATTIASLSKALAEAEKKGAEDWQPIETAPKGKNGVAFMMLAFGPPGDQTVSEGLHFNGRFYAASVFYKVNPNDGRNYAFREHEVRPTHWRPTLAPPRDLFQGGQHG